MSMARTPEITALSQARSPWFGLHQRLHRIDKARADIGLQAADVLRGRGEDAAHLRGLELFVALEHQRDDARNMRRRNRRTGGELVAAVRCWDEDVDARRRDRNVLAAVRIL